MRANPCFSYTIYFCESPLREIIDCRERGPGFDRLQGRTLPRQSPVTPHYIQSFKHIIFQGTFICIISTPFDQLHYNICGTFM